MPRFQKQRVATVTGVLPSSSLSVEETAELYSSEERDGAGFLAARGLALEALRFLVLFAESRRPIVVDSDPHTEAKSISTTHTTSQF